MGAVLTIDLRRLSQAPIEVGGEVASDDPLLKGAGVELASALAVRARAEGTASRGVWVRGSMRGRVRAACRRCLGPVELDVSEDFDLLFDPGSLKDDEDLTLYALDPDADELDLWTPLRERFLLAVPAFPLCREGCRGLCPRCGADREEGDCGCSEDELDPRWAPLQALRDEA